MTFTLELDKTLASLDRTNPEWADHIRTVAKRNPYDRMVGLVIGDNGDPYDVCFGWESCESYATDGMRVLALQGDGSFNRDGLQWLVDNLRRSFRDCFGE